MIFRLNRTRMNALVVKSLADLRSDRHEIVITRGHDVDRCNILRLGELPDVKFMQRQHAIYSQYRILDILY